MLEHGADLGIAWDGDADRCFFIDDTGEFVPGDLITALIARSMLEQHPGATIVYDLRASWAVRDTVERPAARRLKTASATSSSRPGSARKTRSSPARSRVTTTSRISTTATPVSCPALVLLELLSKSGKKLSELLAPFRERYFISGEINSTVDDVPVRLQALKDTFGKTAKRVSHLDGVSFEFDDWHFNVRPSNTEPLLRLNLEALSEATMESRRDEVLALIRS